MVSSKNILGKAGGKTIQIMGAPARSIKKSVSSAYADAQKHPENHKYFGPLHYKRLVKKAILLGVDPRIISRSEIIRDEFKSQKTASDFLNTFIGLYSGAYFPDFYDYFTEHLATDEEKQVALDLMEIALYEARNLNQYFAANVHIMRLKDLSVEDPEVVDFVTMHFHNAIKAKQHARNEKIDPEIFPKMELALNESNEIMKQLRVNCFLFSGTLLGAVREGAFIRSDTSVDLGVFHVPGLKEKIVKAMKAADWKPVRNFEYNISFKNKDGVEVKIYICQKVMGQVICQGWKDVAQWHFSDFNLADYKFLGKTYSVPDNYEKILQENYGNWFDNTIFHDWIYDTQNLVFLKKPESMNYLLGRLENSMKSGSRFYTEKPTQFISDFFGVDLTDWFPKVATQSILPEGYIKRSYKPYVLYASFDGLDDLTIRMFESLRQLSDQIEIAVLSDSVLKKIGDSPCKYKESDRLKFAEGLGFVTRVSLESGSFLHLSANEAKGALMPKKCEGVVVKSIDLDLSIAFYDADSAAVSPGVNGQLLVRPLLPHTHLSVPIFQTVSSL